MIAMDVKFCNKSRYLNKRYLKSGRKMLSHQKHTVTVSPMRIFEAVFVAAGIARLPTAVMLARQLESNLKYSVHA